MYWSNSSNFRVIDFFIQALVPSSRVAMVVADHVVPSTYKTGMYIVAMNTFINDNQDRCQEVYRCPVNLAIGEN